MKMFIKRAADVLLAGGVITCPTEGVYGLSCLPDDDDAVVRLLALKRRDPGKGLILIAANAGQLEDWIDLEGETLPQPDAARPLTWIVRARTGVSPLVRGDHETIAVRITTNPVARAICLAAGSPIVSTSANIAGQPVARNIFVLRRRFTACVDYIVPANCGPASGPSEIRVLKSRQVLRPGRA